MADTKEISYPQQTYTQKLAQALQLQGDRKQHELLVTLTKVQMAGILEAHDSTAVSVLQSFDSALGKLLEPALIPDPAYLPGEDALLNLFGHSFTAKPNQGSWTGVVDSVNVRYTPPMPAEEAEELANQLREHSKSEKKRNNEKYTQGRDLGFVDGFDMVTARQKGEITSTSAIDGPIKVIDWSCPMVGGQPTGPFPVVKTNVEYPSGSGKIVPISISLKERTLSDRVLIAKETMRELGIGYACLDEEEHPIPSIVNLADVNTREVQILLARLPSKYRL